MIDHIVLCRLRPDAKSDDLAAVMAGLAALVVTLDGFHSFHHGPNIDVEGRSPGYTYGFRATFSDRAALAAYADDSDHRRLGAQLVALCNGGADGLFIADIDGPA